ncbi:MAG: low-specificity L-threonine aldolase [Immundisolibacterales bacterium]|nr:low-specificity L-threonine aldolase [Immundisolibacterales bacterium]
MIDFRSDTVTMPTPAMRKLMAAAEVGDDVFGEDPSVNTLEARAAEMAGMEASLFVSSGTQGNLLALLTHCGRGDEFIAGQRAHCYRSEAGGAAALGGIQPQPLDFAPDGTLPLDAVRAAVKPGDDFHYARSRLVCLENTQGGKVLPLDYLAEAESLADELGLSKHLDGARLFNAAVALGIDAKDITRHFDTVSICLSKGLGAPAGTMLCGPRDFIDEARRIRKMLGGAMRQVGIIAAAGLHVLEHHVERLAGDHANAKRLGEGFKDIEEFGFDGSEVHTNMVFVDMDERWRADLGEHLRTNGILISSRNPVRFVTHLDIDEADIDEAVARCKAFFARNR